MSIYLSRVVFDFIDEVDLVRRASEKLENRKYVRSASHSGCSPVEH